MNFDKFVQTIVLKSKLNKELNCFFSDYVLKCLFLVTCNVSAPATNLEVVNEERAAICLDQVVTFQCSEGFLGPNVSYTCTSGGNLSLNSTDSPNCQQITTTGLYFSVILFFSLLICFLSFFFLIVKNSVMP